MSKTPAPKAPKKKPVMIIDDDPAIAAREKESEAARDQAFHFAPVWKGRPLTWSISRESLFYSLREAVGARALWQTLADLDAFFADAIRILYLCSHTPEQWRHHRADPMLWQEEIERWADEAIAPTERQEATMTAFRLLDRAWENQHESASNEKAAPLEK